MSFCSFTKWITPKICRLCFCVLINKRSFEPFMCLDMTVTIPCTVVGLHTYSLEKSYKCELSTGVIVDVAGFVNYTHGRALTKSDVSFRLHSVYMCKHFHRNVALSKPRQGKSGMVNRNVIRVQELCESRGGRPGLPSLISLRFLWT